MSGDRTPNDRPTIADLGEDRALDLLLDALGTTTASGGRVELSIGDDAAVLEVPTARAALTTDTLTEDQDFRADWFSSPRDYGAAVGCKAAAQNLSDVVAVGADPTAVLISLVLPPELDADWIVGFGAGMREALAATDPAVPVIGGDLGSGPVVVVTVTAVGEPGPNRLLRSSAGPGQVLAVGDLGRAAAGLALLEAGHRADGGPPAGLLGAQLRPVVDLSAGRRALEAGARAGMDVSDGLLRDAQRLALASEVVIDIEAEALRPMAEALTDAAEALGATTPEAAEAQALRWTLTGGEDYVLLVTLPHGAAPPEGFTVVGRVLAADEAPAGTVLIDGAAPAPGAEGWDSLR